MSVPSRRLLGRDCSGTGPLQNIAEVEQGCLLDDLRLAMHDGGTEHQRLPLHILRRSCASIVRLLYGMDHLLLEHLLLDHLLLEHRLLDHLLLGHLPWME